MKKINLFWMAMLITTLALYSCDDNDGYSIGDIGSDWATVHVISNGSYSLTGDSWGTLWSAAASLPWYNPVDGQRVIAYFNPLYDNFQGYDHAVKVESIYNVLTKSVEDLTAANAQDYGNDSILIYKSNMWVGGGYLNIVFRQNLPAHNFHRISLVRNTTVQQPDDGYIHLECRYNTYKDVTNYWADAAVSFNLKSLDLNNKKGFIVTLNSIVNGKVEVTFDTQSQSAPTIAQNKNFSDQVSLK